MTIKNTTVNENETDGMVFAKNANDPCLLNRNEMLDDEAQYLDYAADYTERSNNPNAQQSRSPTVFQPTENAMLEGNLTSYRQDLADSPEKANELSVCSLERPFEKQIGQIYLLHCIVQQNRQDGIKSVDYAVQTLGCTIQGNMVSAIRLCRPERGAECEIYMKARSNDSDLIGHILTGAHSELHIPRMKIDPHLPQLLKDLIKVQMIQIYVEIIQMNVPEVQADPRHSLLIRSNEQKLKD